MDEQTATLIAECKRQEESCLYTSATIFEWLKSLRRWRIAFVVLPLVFGGLATWPLLAKPPEYEWMVSACALLAGLMPAIYKALNFDVSLDVLAKHAHEFKILQDRFRQAAGITALAGFPEFSAQFSTLMDRMDKARESSLTPPEYFFKRAQRKIAAGHYQFEIDKH
jgi:hypothetical protein